MYLKGSFNENIELTKKTAAKYLNLCVTVESISFTLPKFVYVGIFVKP